MLIVVGDEDRSPVLEMADTLEQGIAHAKKVVIAGTAHHPNMEKPEEFNLLSERRCAWGTSLFSERCLQQIFSNRPAALSCHLASPCLTTRWSSG